MGNMSSSTQLDSSVLNPSQCPHHPPHTSASKQYILTPPSSNTHHHTTSLPGNLNTKPPQDSKHTELITQYRIRIGVLENELSHAKKDKDDVVSSVGIVIESLTRSTSSLSSVPANGVSFKELEKEIDRLRKENRALRRKIREFETGGQEKDRGDDAFTSFRFAPRADITGEGKAGERESGMTGEEFMASIARGRTRREITPESPIFTSWENKRVKDELMQLEKKRTELLRGLKTGNANKDGNAFHPYAHSSGVDIKGKGKAVGRDSGITGGEFIASMSHGRTGWEKLSASSLNSQDLGYELSGQETEDDHHPQFQKHTQTQPNDSFVWNSPTAPNSPVFASTAVADVGLHSLEDVLNGWDLSPAHAPPTNPGHQTPNGNIINGEDEEERDIDEQLEDHSAALQKFHNLPPPSVLKTGFELKGSFRGIDYDNAPPTYPRATSMQNYNRFGTPSSANIPLGPKTLFPIANGQTLDSKIWDGHEDRNGAIEAHRDQTRGKFDNRFPDFFRYGIRYTPGETDSNFQRTVQISNLPHDTELREVLARVRGGEIVSAILLDTKKLLGGMSARIEFLNEGAAEEEYVLYAEMYPISFGDPPQRATITLVPTPTWPVRLPTRNKVNLGQTRCLRIPNFPTHFSLKGLERELTRGNGHRAAALVEIYLDETMTLHLEFSNVDAAGSAFGILTSFREFRGLEVGWEKDPCAGPLEELREEPKPRPPMLPRNFDAVKRRESGGGEDMGSDRDVVRSFEGMQRKRLAVLSNQKIEIPSFSGARIQSSSWADEVIEEAEAEAGTGLALHEVGGRLSPMPISNGCLLPPNPPESKHLVPDSNTLDNIPEDGEETIAASVEDQFIAIMTESINELMAQRNSQWYKDEGLKRAPVGLAGSKYATHVPGFQDCGPRPRLTLQRGSSGRTEREKETLERVVSHMVNGVAEDEVAIDQTQPTSSSSLEKDIPQNAQTHFHSRSRPRAKSFSDSPPRIQLSDLIASSSSCASASSTSLPSLSREGSPKSVQRQLLPSSEGAVDNVLFPPPTLLEDSSRSEESGNGKSTKPDVQELLASENVTNTAENGRGIDDKSAISPLSLPISLLNHDLARPDNEVKLELSTASATSILNDQANALVTTDKIEGIQGKENGNGELGRENGIGARMYRERGVVNPDEIEIELED
jgi:hypothetical protein